MLYHLECTHLKVTEYLPKWDIGNGIITISHISKRLKEKTPNTVQQLWDGRDLLHSLSDSLGFPLIVARWLQQLQTSLLTELHSVAEMERQGVLCITLLLSWSKIFPENLLVDSLSNPFEQEWITSQTLAARQVGKENVRFSRPL